MESWRRVFDRNYQDMYANVENKTKLEEIYYFLSKISFSLSFF